MISSTVTACGSCAIEPPANPLSPNATRMKAIPSVETVPAAMNSVPKSFPYCLRSS